MHAITPQEVRDALKEPIPDFVYEYMNELIIMHFADGKAEVQEYELIDIILERRPELFGVRNNGWISPNTTGMRAGM